jgi:hypothetical protein
VVLTLLIMQKIAASLLFLFFTFAVAAQQAPGITTAPVNLSDAWENGVRRYILVVKDPGAFRQKAEQAGIHVAGVREGTGIVVVEIVSAAFPAKVLQGSDVLFVDRADRIPKEELLVPGHNLDVNAVRKAQQHFPGLDGSPIRLSIKETRFDTADVDLIHRSSLAASGTIPASNSHASIMATLAGGAGNGAGSGTGVARGVRLLSNGFNNLLPETDFAQTGVSIQNHSYGTDIENHYGANALAYDHSVTEHPYLVHVFSAGNSGLSDPPSGIYAGLTGFANLTGNFKMAKNALVVGAVDSFGQLAPFSSHGPAFDGRLKPDLAAYGQDGTSGAAALVSGAAALIQHALLDAADTLPDAALVRAVLLNSASDIGAPGPDFASGYGNMNLDEALRTVKEGRIVTASVYPDALHTFEIDLPDSSTNFRITLVWDDLPSNPGSSPALVDDLDLVVFGPGGQVWYPWVLDAAPNAASLNAPAVRRRDSLNNVEQVGIEIPAAGTYTVWVRGTSVSAVFRKFSVAWQWERAGRLLWQFPLETAPVEAARDALLRWQHTLPDSVAVLEYCLPGDTAWRLVDSSVDLRKGWYRWAVPDVFAEACLRLRAGGRAFTSDTFMISGTPAVQIGFSCPDSVLLFWDAVAPAASYVLSGLGNKYLEPLMLLPDTFVILKKNDFPQRRFAVTAVGQGGGVGPRSPAPDVTEGGGCYIESFLAVPDDVGQVQISLELGALYGVEIVQIEKWGGETFEPLQVWNAPGSKMLFCADAQPRPGANLYRARLNMAGGGLLSSDTARVYLLEQEALLVFPNPVREGVFSVLGNVESDADFVLFDMMGRLVLETPLIDFPETITLPAGLPKACYPYFLRVGGRFKNGGILQVE